jgi:hypothetical protein
MERACLPPLNRASFANGGQFISSLQGAAAAEPGKWTLELIRARHLRPEDVARLVNDFLARPHAGKDRRTPGS